MEKSYEGIKECHYRVSAKAIIRDKTWRFLLCKEDTWIWDVPGGGIDHGEEIHEALTREIKEEMWLEVTKISSQPVFAYITESSWVSSPKRPICLMMYETEVKNLDFTPSDECTEIIFVTAAEALDLELYYPNIKVMKEIENQEA